MTANERFSALGRLDEFWAAFKRRDRETMIEIYRDAEVEGAEWCVDTMLTNPEKYEL